MKRRLVHPTGKFYEVVQDGHRLTRRWGRIGSAGQERTETHTTSHDAKLHAESLIRKKIDKGYFDSEVLSIGPLPKSASVHLVIDASASMCFDHRDNDLLYLVRDVILAAGREGEAYMSNAVGVRPLSAYSPGTVIPGYNGSADLYKLLQWTRENAPNQVYYITDGNFDPVEYAALETLNTGAWGAGQPCDEFGVIVVRKDDREISKWRERVREELVARRIKHVFVTVGELAKMLGAPTPREVIVQRIEQVGRQVGPSLHIPLHTKVIREHLLIGDRVEIYDGPGSLSHHPLAGSKGYVAWLPDDAPGVVHVNVDGRQKQEQVSRHHVRKIEQPYEVGDEVEVFEDPNFTGIRGVVQALNPNGQATLIQSEKWRGFDAGQTLSFPRQALRRVEPVQTAADYLSSQDTEFVRRLVELAEVLGSDAQRLVLQQEMIDALNEVKKDLILLDELRDIEAALERALNHPYSDHPQGNPRALATMEVIKQAREFARKTDARPFHNDVDKLLRRAITLGLGTKVGSDTQLDRLVASLLDDSPTSIVVTMEFSEVLTQEQVREVAQRVHNHDPHVVRTTATSLDNTTTFEKRR